MFQKTYFLLKINMGKKTPAQTRRFSSEHRWNAGHEKCAPTLGFCHSGARPFELDFKFCFRSTTSWLAYFHWAAEGKRSTTKWKRLKVHKEEKRPCILAHTATVIMTSPDYDLYFWATDNNIFKQNICVWTLFCFLIVLISLNKHSCVELLFTEHSEGDRRCMCVLYSAQVRWLTSQILHLRRATFCLI